MNEDPRETRQGFKWIVFVIGVTSVGKPTKAERTRHVKRNSVFHM